MTNRTPMLAAERRREIVKVVRSQGRIEVSAAAIKFDTSGETIRKDLIALEGQGLLRRVHGGGLRVEAMTFEPGIASRTENLSEKRRVATRGLRELPEGGAVFIDAGSTTQIFADLLPNRTGLQIFTNSLLVAQIVAARPLLTCHTLGGRVRSTTLAEVGPVAQRCLDDLHFDVAFVGTNAISFTRGLSTPDPEEAAIKRGMITSSERVVLLTDHTKFAQTSLVKYANLNEIDLIISGAEVEESHRAALAEVGIEVKLA